jgi:thiazole tautomerase (transcriptional regulator TenI)
MKKPVLHAITNGRNTIEETASICLDICPYVDAIHIREHDKTANQIFELGKRLIETGIPTEKLVVNNRVDAAAALGIQNIQLGYHSLPVPAVKRSFPELSVGKSIHTLTEAFQAVEEGADYLVYGHIFQTDSKEGIPSRGAAEFTSIAAHVSIPLIAIGGIRPSNAREVIKHGCAGIAVMSGIFSAEDPIVAAKDYQTRLEMIVDE